MQTYTYLTHNNGDRPFMVSVTKDPLPIEVKIYRKKQSVFDVTEYDDYELIFSINPIRIFIGKSPLCKMTEFSGGHGDEFDGNSILLKMDTNNKYMFIGHKIFSFVSLHNILDFVSPVGNSDVPYPYAIDSYGNFYLLIEDVIIKNLPLDIDDPYRYYYDLGLITADIGLIPKKKPIIKNFQGIKLFFIDDQQYTLRYCVNAKRDYDRCINPDYVGDDDNTDAIGKAMYITKTDGIKQPLSRNEYIKLMKDFGKAIGVQPIKKLKIMCQ